ncbi:hypothetical protein D3C72_924830 [compost metagenome]
MVREQAGADGLAHLGRDAPVRQRLGVGLARFFRGGLGRGQAGGGRQRVAGGVVGEHARVDQLVEGGQEGLLGLAARGFQQGDARLGAGHGRGGGQGAGAARTAGQALGPEGLEGLGHGDLGPRAALGAGGAGHGAHGLEHGFFHQGRVAVGQIAELGGEAAVGILGAADVPQQLADLLVAETAQAEAVFALGGLALDGEHDADGHGGQGALEVAQQLAAGLVGAVPVVEEQGQAVGAGGFFDPGGDRPAEAHARRAGLEGRGRGRLEAVDQADEHGRELRDDRRRDARGDGREQGRPGAVRAAVGAGGGARGGDREAAQHQPLTELFHEAGLADAGLAGDRDHAARAAVRDLAGHLEQPIQLGAAADEGGGVARGAGLDGAAEGRVDLQGGGEPARRRGGQHALEGRGEGLRPGVGLEGVAGAGHAARQPEMADGPQHVQIGAAVDAGLRAGLGRREPVGGGRLAALPDAPAAAGVGELGRAVGRQAQAVGAEIAMDEAGLMQVGQAGEPARQPGEQLLGGGGVDGREPLAGREPAAVTEGLEGDRRGHVPVGEAHQGGVGAAQQERRGRVRVGHHQPDGLAAIVRGPVDVSFRAAGLKHVRHEACRDDPFFHGGS